jgi:hypothetical protein
MPKNHEDWSHDDSRPDAVLNLKTVHKMLPLVRGIVVDVLTRYKQMAALQPREDRLQRERRTLDWGQRKQRYLLQSDIADHDRAMQDGLDELSQLGVVLLDVEEGRVGFPTLVNNRPAFFTWRPGEDGPHTWQFAEENVARPIPAAWLQELTFTGSKPV